MMMRMKFRPFAILALAIAFAPQGHAEFGSYQSHQKQDQRLVIESTAGQLELVLRNDKAMEVHYQPKGIKQLPGFAVDPNADFDGAAGLIDEKQQLRFGNDHLTAVIHKNPLSLAFERHGKSLVKEEAGLFVQDSLRGFRFALGPEEKILGGGQRVLGMDRRGSRMPLYNKAHYGYDGQSNQMYYGLPAIMSDKHYAIVFDNSASGNLDIGATEKDVLQFEAVGGATRYLVVAGDNFPDLIDHYTELTGRQPLPPRWAFGNFASRFGYRTEQEVRDTVAKFRAQDFPLDALVLDLYWFGKDIQGHMGNLDWDKAAFPAPTQMLADLKADGVNTVVITEPFILTSSKRWQEAVDADVLAKNVAGQAKTFNFYFGNTGLIDVFNKPAQAWFWSIYQELMLQGVAGWWGDLGEPEVHPDDSLHRLDNQIATANEVHNAYGHQWAKLVYENQRRRFPDSRPMIMMRSGFAGSQRYGMIPWTGDVSRSWGGLKPQVELALQMSLFGLAYTHSDLGGFAGGETFDPELYVRWLQYGVFQPVYRPHAQEHIAPEPVFHSEEVQDLLRPYVKLRYQLLPYNYTLAYQNSTRGLPLMRPLFFEDAAQLNNSVSYLWGDAFLVTPVTEAGVKSVSVALPKGVWYDYFTGQRYPGGKTIEQPTELKNLPVLVRAGSFVPMVDAVQSTRDYSSQSLALHYYYDKTLRKGQGQMYEDDGRDPEALAKGRYELLDFNAEHQRSRLNIKLERTHSHAAAPAIRKLALTIHHLPRKPRAVKLGDQLLDFHYQNQTLTLSLDWNHQATELTILQDR